MKPVLERPETNHCCSMMDAHLREQPSVIVYVPKFREYGLPIYDGGSSHIVIPHCPWCGTRLPESLRDEWFDRLDKLGLEPGDPAIPEALKSDAWWHDRK